MLASSSGPCAAYCLLVTFTSHSLAPSPSRSSQHRACECPCPRCASYLVSLGPTPGTLPAFLCAFTSSPFSSRFSTKPNLYLANTRDPNALCIDTSNCAVETSTHAPSLLMTSARIRERAPALKPRLLRLIRPSVMHGFQPKSVCAQARGVFRFERSKGGDPQAPVSDSPVVRERRPITLNLSCTSLEA